MKSLISSMPVSLSIGLAVLGYGLYSFLTQWQYSEAGHEMLLITYLVGAVLVFFALRFSKIGIAVALIICLLPITIYANKKFEWRESYIHSAQKGNYFAMERYIDAYPSFEDHYFNWVTGAPKWVEFSSTCYEPLLKSDNLLETKKGLNTHCKSASSIQNEYGIDIKTIINDHYRKMQNTAKMLEKGRFKNKRRFEGCINDKKCAMIPLLPAGVEVDQQSEDYLDIRKQFWSLINDKTISTDNCNFFDFCRVMTNAEIIAFDKI